MHDQKYRYPTISKRSGSSPARRTSLPTSRSADKDTGVTLVTVLKHAMIGMIGFIVCGLTLVTAACTAAYASSDPSSLITPLGLAALLLSSFAGGFVTVKLTRTAPLLCGMVFGGMAALVMLLLSFVFSASASSHYTFMQGLLMHGFALLFSLLGAFTGNYKRKPNPKKRRFGNG